MAAFSSSSALSTRIPTRCVDGEAVCCRGGLWWPQGVVVGWSDGHDESRIQSYEPTLCIHTVRCTPNHRNTEGRRACTYIYIHKHAYLVVVGIEKEGAGCHRCRRDEDRAAADDDGETDDDRGATSRDGVRKAWAGLMATVAATAAAATPQSASWWLPRRRCCRCCRPMLLPFGRARRRQGCSCSGAIACGWG